MRHQIISQNGVLNACGEQRHDERCVEMVSNTTDSAAAKVGQHRERPQASAERLLSLAAAPTFAIMALLTWVNGGGSMSDMLCAAAPDPSPLGGMVAMYLLMSAFHVAPWLKLISLGRSGARRSSQTGFAPLSTIFFRGRAYDGRCG